MEREHNQRAWAVWHIAALSRAKRLVPFDKLKAKAKPEQKPRQTWQQQLEIMKSWAAKQNMAVQALQELRDGR